MATAYNRVVPAHPLACQRHLPCPAMRANIIRGLLECDLLGFHTHDYARHFTASAPRVLQGVRATPGALWYHDRRITVGVYPIGIEPETFEAVQQTNGYEQRLSALGQHYEGVKLIVAVDRLDPIKGIPHRLLGFEAFLHAHPEWVGKVTLLQVAVPSRTDVPAYQALAAACSTLVGRINGTFGSLGWTPVQYLFRSIDPTELTALYSLADCCLITSLRDGMNLVSMEYIACTAAPNAYRTAPGVLTLSEFAGSAQSLAGAVRCSPWDAQDIARAIHASLTMSDRERTVRHELLHAYVKKYTSAHWAVGFVEAMAGAGAGTDALVSMDIAVPQKSGSTDSFSVEDLRTCYTSSSNRLVLISFEQLFPAAASPHGARVAQIGMPLETPQKSTGDIAALSVQGSLGAVTGLTYRSSLTPGPGSGLGGVTTLDTLATLGRLRLLASDPANIVVVCSTKADQATMLDFLESVPEACLVAEGGCAVRLPANLSACTPEHIKQLQEIVTSLQQDARRTGQNTSEAIAGQHETRASLADVFSSSTTAGTTSTRGSSSSSTQQSATGYAGRGSPAGSLHPTVFSRPFSTAQRAVQLSVQDRAPPKSGLPLPALRTDVGLGMVMGLPLSAPFSPARLMSPGRMPLVHAAPGTPTHAIWTGAAQQQARAAHSRSSSSSVGVGVSRQGGALLSRVTTPRKGDRFTPSSMSKTSLVAAQGTVWVPVAPDVVLIPTAPAGSAHSQGQTEAVMALPQAPSATIAAHSHRVSALDVPPPVESEKPGAPVLPPPPAAVPEVSAPADLAVGGTNEAEGASASRPLSTTGSTLPKATSMASTASTLSSVVAASSAAPSPAAKQLEAPATEGQGDWKGQIKPLLAHYAVLTPGAYVSESANTLTFHYGASDPDQGEWTARELLNHLQASTAAVPLEIALSGSAGEARSARSLQVRIRGTGLTDALSLILHRMCGMRTGQSKTSASVLTATATVPVPPLHMILACTDSQDKTGFSAAIADLQHTSLAGKPDPLAPLVQADTSVFFLRPPAQVQAATAAGSLREPIGASAEGGVDKMADRGQSMKLPGLHEALSTLANETALRVVRAP